ncbi:hypothetical protein ACC793_33470 [Rhizobium ruizarguesonis]|jgi:hypothetical protein
MMDAVGDRLNEATQRHRQQPELIEDSPRWQSPAKFQVGASVLDTMDDVSLIKGQWSQ